MACANMGMDDLNANETYEFAFLKIDIVEHSSITRDSPYQQIEKVFDVFEKYVEKHVSGHNGTIWGWQGDGGLCAFLGKDTTDKACNAFKAAESILTGLDNFNENNRLPRGYRVRVRIAVHLGNAKYRGREALGRIHSEAINFVAHLESQKTNVNGISISHEVHKELTEDMQKRFEAFGKFEARKFIQAGRSGLSCSLRPQAVLLDLWTPRTSGHRALKSICTSTQGRRFPTSGVIHYERSLIHFT